MAERSFGGWSFSDRLEPDGGGLILSTVSHQGYPMAHDIRVPRVWVAAPEPRDRSGGPDPVLKAKKRSYVLGSPDLPAKNQPFELIRGGQAPGDFAIYPISGGLGVDYEAETAIPGKRNDILTINQRYLFGPYSKHPSHEPGSVLRAARIFPLLEFRLKPGKENLPGPSYFRADFRFDLVLHNKGDGNDLGAVFRDSEDVPLVIPSEGNLLRPPVLYDVFEGAEKPLHHELIGSGLRERAKLDTGPDRQTWDNYHHFPRDDKGKLPSSPGAFHCFHTHWRWGAVSVTGKFPVLTGGKQFAGLNWTEELGGPMIDPRIPAQDLTFAITRDSRAGTPLAASANPSEWPFTELFTRWRANPAAIKKEGAAITFWISVEVNRPAGAEHSEWGGTLLPHGMFFSHDSEPGLFDPESDVSGLVPIQIAAAGLRNPLHKESVSASANPMPWMRYPPGPKK